MKPDLRVLVGTFIAFCAQLAMGYTQGRVSLSQASFVSPDYKLTGKKDYHLVGAGLDTLGDIRREDEIDNSLQAEVRGMVAPGSSVLNYLNVTQLFWKQSNLTVGRKKVLWSQLDENFTLGTYQPIFKWNPLHWETQGLSGIFIHFESSDSALPWGVTAMGSPIFIPNQGASYELRNGSFQESNPYFKAPPSKALVNGQEFDVDYNIQKPETQDIVFRESFAGRLFIGDYYQGPYAQVAYANKPMNELNLGFIGYAAYPENGNLAEKSVSVDILPEVSNHTVFSGDLHYSAKHIKVGISALHEEPKEPKFEAPWTYATFTPSTLVSPFVEFKLYSAKLDLGYLNVDGGESVGAGPEADQAVKFMPQRYPFRNAGFVGLKYQHRIKRFENIAFATKFLAGATGEFNLWTTQASYQWQERWAASLTGQLLAVENNTKGEGTAYYPYESNDLVAIGVSYVF